MGKRKEKTRRMREQRYVVDSMIGLVGINFEWPGNKHVMSFVSPEGAKDARMIEMRVKKFIDIPREYAKCGNKWEATAKKAEDEGHTETARNAYLIASTFYGSAQTPIHEDDDEENILYNSKKIECYKKYIEYAPYPIERVEIPFEGNFLPGYLYLPEKNVKKMPTILRFNGMHGFKEMLTPRYGDKFLERGMVVLAMDGPGQSEAIMRKIRCTADNFGRAGKAAMDYMLTRPEIDPDRIAVHGSSMGSFWVTQVAAYEHRFKAAVAQLACHEPAFDTMFEKAPPTFKERYMWLAGYEDEAEFDKFTKTLTLEGIGAKITCPILIIAGSDDQLSSIEHTYNLFNEIQAPKKLIVYEGEIHGCENYVAEISVIIADWVKDRLDGKPMQSENVFVETSGREILKKL